MESPTPPKPKKGLAKTLMISVLVLVVAGLAYVGYTNPQLFRASISELPTPVAGAAHLYIPNFQAGPNDSGKIWVSTRAEGVDAVTEDLVSMQFKLKWSPASDMTLDENSIVFDSETVFKAADFKSVNTSTPGEAIISFFSNNKVEVTSDTAHKLFKLNVQLKSVPGRTITLQATDEEAVLDSGAGNYQISSNFSAIDAGAFTVSTQADLRVVSAEALPDNKVLVRFSDLLSAVGPQTDYAITDEDANTLIASSAVGGVAEGYGQDTVVLTIPGQIQKKAYELLVQNNVAKGNVQGSLDANYRKAKLFGYSSDIAESDAKISPIDLEKDVMSSNSLLLHFDKALDRASVTPVNIKIEKLLPTAGLLTITKTELSTDLKTVTVTTAQQEKDVNYFVSMNGVKDAQDKLLANNAVQSFFGFKSPTVVMGLVRPVAMSNNTNNVLVVMGDNLDTVEKAYLNTTEIQIQIDNQTKGAMSLSVPKDFATGIYDLRLVNTVGESTTLTKALIVQAPIAPLTIDSTESKAIPYRVAPDGKTPVTFWVLVKDPKALNQVSSVTIDLQKIGGNRAQEMEKDTGTQKQYSQFYKYTTTVAATTPTGTTTLKLPVEVRKGTEVKTGTVEILVTRNVIQSVPPVIDQAYANPSTLPPDGETEGKISAKITDPDGASTVTSVVADFGATGIDFVILSPVNVSETALTGYFSGTVKIPKGTPEKTYTVTVTAEDETGGSVSKTLTLTVSTALSAPKFDAAKSYVGPRKSVPRDGKTPFAVHAFISDPDGVSDIDSVTAYFGTSGLTPVALTRDPSATETSKSALYSSGDIVFPPVTPLGVQQVELVAVDKMGGQGNLILQVDVTDKDTLSEAPFINSSKAYTSPKIALNDGETPISLYAFVRDDDNDLESVVVNLTGIGQVGPELPADFGEVGASAMMADAGDGVCPSGSTGIVCMTPSFKEGNLGQWFVLSGVTISKDTAASVQPYQVEVMATDAAGNVTRGKIPLSVRDNLTVSADKSSPEVVAAVPVGSGSVEVVFSKALDPMSISASGNAFGITESQDITKKLTVLGSTINASGMVVTVTTDSQQAGKDYVLTVSNKVTDAAGIALVSGRKSQASFKAFEDSDKGPVVDFVGATDGETVQIDFQNNLRPSSVTLGEASRGGDFNIKIFEADSGTPLAIKAVRFVESGKSLEVKTDPQKSGMRYRAQISKIASAAGIGLKSAIGRPFVAINMRAVQKAAVAGGADLNGDGKVDFIDFTMFSAVYGQSLQVPVDSGLAGGQGLNPIEPRPDSTVPHTQVP